MGSAGLGRLAAGPALFVIAGCATVQAPPSPNLVWPLAPDTPRVQYLESFSRSDQFAEKRRDWLREVVFGPDGKNVTRMVKPYAVTTDQKNRLYVSDTGLSAVWVFDREKKEVRFIGDSGQGKLATPAGIVVDSRGIVFVADAKLRKVFAYDDAGNVVLGIGQADEFTSPSGLAIDPASGRLFVADAGRHKIRVYDSQTGQFLFEFGQRGIQTGQFNFPTHLFLRQGVLYVTDTMNFRVQVFSLDGKFLRKYGEMGAKYGQLARPKGVAVDSEGHVYVVDAAFGNFQIFNGDAELLLFVGRTGISPGEFYLPAGMFIDGDDRIYVVDQYNRRVQVFQYLGAIYLAKAKLAKAKESNGQARE